MNCLKCGQIINENDKFCPKCGASCATTSPVAEENLAQNSTNDVTAESIIMPEYKEEKIIPGILGALLFSLVGGIVCFILYQLNYVAALSGVIGVLCALKGYEMFSGKLTKKGVVISFIASIAAVILAMYVALGYSICEAINEYAVQKITIFDAISYIPETLAQYSDLSSAFYSDVAMSVVFSIIGSIGYVVKALKSPKKNKDPLTYDPGNPLQ